MSEKKPMRRDSKGRFKRRGHFIVKDGKLFRTRPVPTFGKKPVGEAAVTGARGAASRPAGPAGAPPARPAPRRRVVYSTWFRAMGIKGGDRADLRGKSPDALGDDLVEYAAPSAFYSNQAALLGRVKWPGIVPLEDLIDRLNVQLQYVGEESDSFDFREAYDYWEFKYQVIETRGGVDFVIDTIERNA